MPKNFAAVQKISFITFSDTPCHQQRRDMFKYKESRRRQGRWVLSITATWSSTKLPPPTFITAHYPLLAKGPASFPFSQLQGSLLISPHHLKNVLSLYDKPFQHLTKAKYTLMLLFSHLMPLFRWYIPLLHFFRSFFASTLSRYLCCPSHTFTLRNSGYLLIWFSSHPVVVHACYSTQLQHNDMILFERRYLLYHIIVDLLKRNHFIPFENVMKGRELYKKF